MSNYFKIEPVYKKSITDNMFWERKEDDGELIKFSTEELYRWGHFVIKTDLTLEQVKDELNADDEKYGQFDSDDWELEDQELDDSCSYYFNNCYNIDEETLEQLYEENSSWEEHGYDNIGYRYDINGPMKVTDVTDEYNK